MKKETDYPSIGVNVDATIRSEQKVQIRKCNPQRVLIFRVINYRDVRSKASLQKNKLHKRITAAYHLSRVCC